MPSIISCLFLLLIIDWSYTLSLHSLFQSNSDSQLSAIERRRRWNKNQDNDEEEIPLNETVRFDTSTIDDITTFNTIVNTTLLNFETIEESNSTIHDIFNSTINSTIDTYSNENTTVIQDLIEFNQTDINKTIDSNQNETESIGFQSSSNSTIVYQIELTTIMENNQTNDSKLSVNETFISTNDEFIIHSTQKDAIVNSSEIYLNETDIISINSNESSIIISKSVSIPICDYACQCLKECPYGFEILNETCLCNPPCKNYQCFGNDTCVVMDNGKPLCKPENDTEHDRPIRCYQPRDAGYHDTNIRYYNRWYYHPDQDTCHLFVYRGLGGNENNFQTLNECHSECITCAPLPDPGECLGHINMWYFDKKEKQCKQFEYSGCKGNENKFLKKEQCIDACINRIYNL